MNTIIEETTEHGDVPVDVYQKLSEDRILFICDDIDDKLATDIVATLLLEDAKNCDEKITLFINSEGGDVRSAFMIYDVMQLISAPIETICIGASMDMASIILASGSIGSRMATKNSVICVSQLEHDYTIMTDLTDAKKYLDQSITDNKKMMEILSRATKKSVKQVISDFDRRVFMSAKQAMNYGIIDKVI